MAKKSQKKPTETQKDGKLYRLSDPNTQYTDTISGWTLTSNQSKAFPKHPTPEMMERVKRGFFVEDSVE